MDRQAFIAWFNPRLQAFVEERIEKLQSAVKDDVLASLVSHVSKLTNEGKRIRPFIAYLAAEETRNEQYAQYINIFAAIELFHVFGLIHDDIIDRGALRRGIPTLHVEAEARMKQEGRVGDISHMAHAQALLLGDLVHGWVIELFHELRGKNEATVRAAEYELQAMTREVVAGQMIDVDLMTKERGTMELIEQKMELKTASYTFTRPMRMGFAIAGGTEDQLAFADTFGKELGLGFQIQDDYLDLFGDPNKTGKVNFSDLEVGQHTYFTQYIFDHGSVEHIRALEAVFRKKIDLPAQDVQRLFEESGAKDAGLKRIEQHMQEARQLLDLTNRSESRFADLLSMIESRTC
ncbi:MAG: polyprenyl synthetase family protein [bacterium]|nr:polyprenyl synthetase family protein [bacterium]MDA1024342.1 polyprenyl synthetase family protein [bacterium]